MEDMNMNLPKVSILVVNYNGRHLLKEFLDSAINLNYPKNRYEIVIVDNGSSDGSVEFMKKKYRPYISNTKKPRIKIVELDKNYGFTGGNNRGIKYCSGEYLALINNDTIMDKNWLKELVRVALDFPKSLLGSKMLLYDKRDIIVYGGGKLLAWGTPMHMWLWENDKNDFRNKPEKTFYADGCGLLIPKTIFLKVGGFDEDYFAYADDYALSWRARLLGYEVYFVPTAKFYHKISATGGEFSYLHVRNFYRNHLRSIIKFAGFPTVLYMVPFFMIYGVGYYILIYLLKEKKLKLILPIIRAYFDILLELPTLLSERKKYQKSRKVNDRKFKEEELILSFTESIKEVFRVLKRRRIREL
jgi:GT2 family glycosyltransferase